MEGAAPPEAYTLEAIRPLLAAVRVDGRDLHVVFRCPSSGQFETVHRRAPPCGVSGMTVHMRNTSRLYAVRAEVNGLIRGLLGYGVAGRWARQVADRLLAGEHPYTQLDTEEEEQGVVEAFRSIAHRFRWEGGRWVHRGERARGRLERRVLQGEGLSPYDRDVAMRMVVEVAQVHGGISDEERSHLLDIFEDAGSLQQLLDRPPLTDAELAETSRGSARRRLLAMAWSMALCDEHFDEAERALLDRYGRALGIPLEEQVAIQLEAQVFVLEQLLERALAWGGHDRASREQLRRLAARIGASPGLVERTEARFLKRARG